MLALYDIMLRAYVYADSYAASRRCCHADVHSFHRVHATPYAIAIAIDYADCRDSFATLLR